MSHYRIYDSSFYFRESTSLKAGIDVPLLSMAKNKYSFIYKLSGIRQLLYQNTWSNAYHKILDLRRWLFKTHCHCSSRICQCVHCTRIVFLPDLRTFFWWHIFSPPSLDNFMSKSMTWRHKIVSNFEASTRNQSLIHLMRRPITYKLLNI